MPEAVSLEVCVEEPRWRETLPALDALAEDAVQALGQFLGVQGGATALFTSDEAVRALNARFRGKDAPTNVLAFPAARGPGDDGQYWGDLALAYETVCREALAQGKTLRAHLAHLIVHGLLHLLGRDHETDADAEVMEAEERAILARLEIEDPYAAEAPTP